MSTAPAKTEYSPEILAEAKRLNIPPEKAASLRPAERAMYERKAARRISDEQAADIKARAKVSKPSPLAAQRQAKAERAEEAEGRVPHIVLAKRVRPTKSAAGRQKYLPGDIIPRPDSVDLKLLEGGGGEPLGQWWGGELAEPARVEGRIYPALQQRPADGSIWLQDDPLHLTALRQATLADAAAALRRCRNQRILQTVADTCSGSLGAIARAALRGALIGGKGHPLELLLEGRQLRALLSDGLLGECEELLHSEMAVLIASCEDEQTLLAVLAKRALADNHDDARKRIAELKAAAKAAAEAQVEASVVIDGSETNDGSFDLASVNWAEPRVEPEVEPDVEPEVKATAGGNARATEAEPKGKGKK